MSAKIRNMRKTDRDIENERRKRGPRRNRRQIDEIEVLTSIYGEDWHVEDESIRQYYIDIDNGSESNKLRVRLQVILPPDYPTGAPPQYSLNGPWLRGQSRIEIENSLQDLYIENVGESILYLWIEKVREFLQEYSEKSPRKDGGSPEATGGGGGTDEGETGDLSEQLISSWTEPDAGERVEPQDAASHEIDDATTIEFIKKKSLADIPCPEIHHSEFLSDRKSKFQSHLAVVNNKEEVEVVRNKLLENRKIAAATHNIIAYRIRVPNTEIMYKSCEDDGEFGAGGRMLHLLDILDAENVMVVVTRWYGGIHLGPDRFKHINNLAREILQQHGFVREKGDKKGPRSTKKR